MGSGKEGTTQLRDLGWRQGTLLPPQLFDALKAETDLEFQPGKHVVAILSQDCDVVHPSYELEPSLEIVRGTIIEKLDGTRTFAKSSRKLHLELSSAAGPVRCEFSIHERRTVPRQILEGSRPDSGIWLSREAVRVLTTWVVNRYGRASFPDEFVRRLQDKKARQKLEAHLRRMGHKIMGLYALLRPDSELPSERPYELTLWAVARVSDFEANFDTLERDFLQPLTGIMRKFQGIDLIDAMLVSDAEFSLEDIRTTRRMDWDYLSLRDEGEEIAG